MNNRNHTLAGLLAVSLFTCLVTVSTADAQWLKDQAITFANFDYVRSISNSQREVFFATTNGIIVYDKIRQHWQEPLTGADGLDPADIVNVRTDRFGHRLLVATPVEVLEYNKLFGRWAPITGSAQLDAAERHVAPPEMLTPDSGGTPLGGGRFVDWLNRTWHTTDIVNDQAGTLWIGTWGLGAAMAPEASERMTFLPYGLMQNHVAAILADDSLIWFGGPVIKDMRTGVTAYNPDKNSFFYLESGLTRAFTSHDVNCMAADDQRLYVGTTRGVFRVDKSTWEFLRPVNRRLGLTDEDTHALAVAGNSLMIGTTEGLYALDLTTDSLFTVWANTFANQVIYDLAPVDSTVWIASSVGAYRYSPQAGTLQRYQDSTLVLFAEVYDIEHSGDNTWFVSNGGLVRLNRRTGESTPFREQTTGTTRRALAVNEKIAAVTSDGGLTLIFLDRETPLSKEFDERDGLASSTIYSLLLDGPHIWVGTDKGVTRFLWDNPDRVD